MQNLFNLFLGYNMRIKILINKQRYINIHGQLKIYSIKLTSIHTNFCVAPGSKEDLQQKSRSHMFEFAKAVLSK